MALCGTPEESKQRVPLISGNATESAEVLTIIKGYTSEPLVSLETAVKPLISLLPEIERHAYAAKKKCKAHADGLTQDQSASIMLYTMRWEPVNECLNTILTKTLQSKDSEKVKPWFSYLKLLFTALSRLPHKQQTVYLETKSDSSETFSNDQVVDWWCFNICAPSIDALQSREFFSETSTRTIFIIDCYSCKDIHNHSNAPTTDKVLLPPAQFKVVNCLDNGNGFQKIQLKEMKPLFPFPKETSPGKSYKVFS